MGGAAFASGEHPLCTPRMPPDVYNPVRRRCMAALRGVFWCVASPIDGPGKQDHGDVDVLVAWPRQGAAPGADGIVGAVADALGAARTVAKGGSTSHFAIPWPAAASHGQPSPSAGPPWPRPDRYIQVDVRICASVAELQWMLFRHAHGDLWNVLGSVVRPYGLTIDECALWLRIPEIEGVHRARAKVFLTSEPSEVLSFVGLGAGGDEWERPFEELDAMFEYAAQCRMMCVGGDAAEASRARDRRRLKARPAFRRWMEEFVPACRRAGRFAEPRTSRGQVAAEAFARWPAARYDYDARRDAFAQERQRDTIWHALIRGGVPAPDAAAADARAVAYRACQVKALRRVILGGDASYGVVCGAGLRDARGFWRLDEVAAFIRRHGDEIGAAAYGRQTRQAMRGREGVVTARPCRARGLGQE